METRDEALPRQPTDQRHGETAVFSRTNILEAVPGGDCYSNRIRGGSIFGNAHAGAGGAGAGTDGENGGNAEPVAAYPESLPPGSNWAAGSDLMDYLTRDAAETGACQPERK